MAFIKKIDIIGDCTHDYSCSHFCMITYKNNTYQTIKMSGIDIVPTFWNLLSDKDKKHFQYIYDLYNLKKINVSKKTINDKHACEFTYKNGDKKKYLVAKQMLHYYRDYIN